MLGEGTDWDHLPDVDGVDLWEWDCPLDGVRLDADVVIGYSMGGRLALHALDPGARRGDRVGTHGVDGRARRAAGARSGLG